MTPMDNAAAPDALRQLVREVLRDILPAQGLRDSPPSAAPAVPTAPSAVPTAPSAVPTAPSAVSAAPSAVPRVLPAVPPTSDPVPSRPTAAAGVTETAGAGGSRAAATRSDVTRLPVRLATDEELHEFVLRVLRLGDNPKRRRDLLAGRLRFTLASGNRDDAAPGAHAGAVSAGHDGAASGRFGPAAANGPGGRRPPAVEHGAAAQADHRIGKGAVTERAVQAAASAGARLVLGPRAVLTPLARDRARALGVPIEKER